MDAHYRMNKINYHYQRLIIQRNRVFALLFLSGSLTLAGCLSEAATVPAATATYPPAPEALGTEAPPLAAYPPPNAGYPGPVPTTATNADNAASYPGPATAAPLESTPHSSADPTIPDAVNATSTEAIYFPVIGEGEAELPPPTATPTVAPSPTATMTPPSPTEEAVIGALPTPINVIDFAAVGENLTAQGQQLAYNKIGFHVTFLEESDELDPYMQRLDSEGVPFFLKSVDNAEPLYKAQELMKVSGVDHTLVYRSTRYDVPDYELDPILAAEYYWELEKAIWPPELDPGLVWFETTNEPDKNRAEWLAEFSLRTAQLALRDGHKWAAFGWSSGEPEPSDWESPAMLELLRLIGENPDQLAIALHEYSYVAADIGHEFPHKIGRFLDLFAIADKHGIPRPTVLITEWGWTYNDIPAEPDAMEDIAWAARFYGAYPQVRGAAIWNLGKLDDTLLPLNTQVQGLIDNMLAFSLDSYFSAPQPPEQAPLDSGQFPPPSN
jgi:hypothetical protein